MKLENLLKGVCFETGRKANAKTCPCMRALARVPTAVSEIRAQRQLPSFPPLKTNKCVPPLSKKIQAYARVVGEADGGPPASGYCRDGRPKDTGVVD